MKKQEASNILWGPDPVQATDLPYTRNTQAVDENPGTRSEKNLLWGVRLESGRERC